MNYLDTCRGVGCPMRDDCRRYTGVTGCYPTRGRVSAETGEFACQQYEAKDEHGRDER